MRLMLNSFYNNLQVRNQLPDLIHDVECFFASGLSSEIECYICFMRWDMRY